MDIWYLDEILSRVYLQFKCMLINPKTCLFKIRSNCMSVYHLWSQRLLRSFRDLSGYKNNIFVANLRKILKKISKKIPFQNFILKKLNKKFFV